MTLDRMLKSALASSRRAGTMLALALALFSSTGMAGIIWNGDFSTGSFIQYHHHEDDKLIQFQSTPPYGRPPAPRDLPGGFSYDQTGNGELLDIVTSPTRGTTHAARFVVKSAANEAGRADCDPRGGGMCQNRRNNLWMQRTHARWYDALPHMGERWVSWSIYLPSDFPTNHIGSSFFNLFSIKQDDDSWGSGYFRLELSNGMWRVRHSWRPSRDNNPSQFRMRYAGNEGGKPYPRADSWPDGLADFPDVATSHAALRSVNKGGWTDWILHFKQDHRGSNQGGTGFLTLWKREDSGPWIKLLHILPKETTRGGMTFNHGIGYNLSGSKYGAGANAGLYLSTENVHPTKDMVLYMANIKIGDENTTFADMSHDGSTPHSQAPAAAQPKAPVLRYTIER